MSDPKNRPLHAALPWQAVGTVLRDANGNSIASGGNNRAITGEKLRASLEMAAQCANVHDELVRALEKCRNALLATGVGSGSQAARDAIDHANTTLAAIAKTAGGAA